MVFHICALGGGNKDSQFRFYSIYGNITNKRRPKAVVFSDSLFQKWGCYKKNDVWMGNGGSYLV